MAALAIAGSTMVGTATSASAADPAGCTSGYVTLGSGYAWARCNTSAPGIYYRAAARCRSTDAYGRITDKYYYGAWIWQSSSGESKAWCPYADQIMSASAQISY